jgi:hypothetical protein
VVNGDIAFGAVLVAKRFIGIDFSTLIAFVVVYKNACLALQVLWTVFPGPSFL